MRLILFVLQQELNINRYVSNQLELNMRVMHLDNFYNNGFKIGRGEHEKVLEVPYYSSNLAESIFISSNFKRKRLFHIQ